MSSPLRERDMGGGLGSGWGAILLSLLLIVENERTEIEGFNYYYYFFFSSQTLILW